VTDKVDLSKANSSEVVWTQEMVRRFWAYERRRPENYFSFQVGGVVTRRFRRYLGGRVVDYGAGTGFLVEELLAAGVQCGAVEFGEHAAQELSNRFVGQNGFLGARDSINLADWKGSFDAAFLVEVVEHLYDEDLQQCLSAVRSLLKPGGRLIVTTPNEEDRSKSFICSPESGLPFHRFQHVRSWSAQSLESLLTKNGFKIAAVGSTDFGAHPLAHKRTMSLPTRLVRSAAKRLVNRNPHLYCIALLAEGRA
jgi:2-polyprenyl-3-methyl-5-hydroxy-6-metoxy-1,4-benzoquinol methylase